MTFRQLAEAISRMTESEKDEIVRFLEPYDCPASHEIELDYTDDDIDSEDDDETLISGGTYYLK